VKQLAIVKQREWITNKINQNRKVMTGHFTYHFEEFTRLPIETEIDEVKSTVDEYLRPSVVIRQQLIDQAHEEAPKMYQRVQEEIIKDRKEKIQEYFNEKIKQDHIKKCKRLEYAKEVIGLNREEILELLDLEQTEYETDIGVADAQMDKIRVEIYNLEAKRKHYEVNFRKQMEMYDAQSKDEEQLLQGTNENVEKLMSALHNIQQQEKELMGGEGGMSLSAMDERTVEMINEMNYLTVKSKEIKAELEESILGDLATKEQVYMLQKRETELEEEKALGRKQKVEDLLQQEKDRENRLQALRDKIDQLKEAFDNSKDTTKNKRKQNHVIKNQMLAKIAALESIIKMNNTTTEYYQFEKRVLENINLRAMEKLRMECLRLQSTVRDLEVNQGRLIESLTFMKAFVNKGRSISLEHNIATIHKDDCVQKMEEIKRIDARIAAAFGDSKLAEWKKSQTPELLVNKAAIFMWDTDERAATLGSDFAHPEVVSNREKRLREMRTDVVKRAFREQRILSMINALSPIVKDKDISQLLQALPKRDSMHKFTLEPPIMDIMKVGYTSTQPSRPLLDIWNTVTRSMVEERESSDRQRRMEEDSRAKSIRDSEDLLRKKKREALFAKVGNIVQEFGMYVNLDAAIGLMHDKMHQVQKQKSRAEEIKGELERIKSLNEPMSTRQLRMGVNQMLVVDESRTGMKLDSNKLKSLQGEKVKKTVAGMFSPSDMLRKLRQDKIL
jgi:hypothetical protein